MSWGNGKYRPIGETINILLRIADRSLQFQETSWTNVECWDRSLGEAIEVLLRIMAFLTTKQKNVYS